MFLLMGINLYAARLLLLYLGIEDYGIYNVIGGIVSMFTFIGGAMIASTQRYLNFYLGKSDDEKLCRVFNASIIIHLAAAVIVVITCETVGLWYLYNKMVLPPSRLDAAFWAFQCCIVATSGIVMSYPYNACIIAHERMAAFAYISIYEAIMKLFIVYLLYLQFSDNLIVYAVSLMFVQLSVTAVYRIYCHRHFSETAFMWRGVTWQQTRELMVLSGWNFLGNISAVFLVQGTNLLLNLFFGPTVNAAKGIAVQVQHLTNQFFTNFQSAQNPQIIKTYAAGEMDAMHKLIFRSTHISFYLALIITVPLFFKIDGVLNLWLTNVPEYSGTFVQYTLLFGLIQTMATPIHIGCMATGNIRWLMILTSIVFWSVIPLGYIGLKYTDNPIFIFRLLLSLYIIGQIVRIDIAARLLHFSRIRYLSEVIVPLLSVTSVLAICCWSLSLLFQEDLISLLLFGCSCMVVICIVCFILGLNRSERDYIIAFLKRKINIK